MPALRCSALRLLNVTDQELVRCECSGRSGSDNQEGSPDGLSNRLEVSRIVSEGLEQPLLQSFFFLRGVIST